jgi:hypothetical protein
MAEFAVKNCKVYERRRQQETGDRKQAKGKRQQA